MIHFIEPCPMIGSKSPLCQTTNSKLKSFPSICLNSLPEQSDPASDLYTFAYSITITNKGNIAAQVISRSWSVNDANGLHEKIKGLGVVGYQPLLQPGEKFQYTSGTRLRTPTGTMHGSYFCVAEDGEKFDADIPMFVLDALSNESGKRNLH
ncbi:MAG: Protein ApaG [Pseudomonadota bacterium]